MEILNHWYTTQKLPGDIIVFHIAPFLAFPQEIFPCRSSDLLYQAYLSVWQSRFLRHGLQAWCSICRSCHVEERSNYEEAMLILFGKLPFRSVVQNGIQHLPLDTLLLEKRPHKIFQAVMRQLLFSVRKERISQKSLGRTPVAK